MTNSNYLWVVVCLGLVGVASNGSAAENWEVTILGGWTAPAISTRTVIAPNVEIPNLPGTFFRQQGEFALSGRGSAAFGGSVAYFFNSVLGIEGRFDSAGVKVDVEGPIITSTTPLTPLPPLTTTLDLSDGGVTVERLTPFSLNLKARTGDSKRFIVSGGVSYLPKLAFSAYQRATFGIGSDFIGNIPIASIAVEGSALTDVPARERFGFNVGAGVDIVLSERLSFVGEARLFGFPKQTLTWRDATIAGSRFEEILLETLRNDLPLELNPTFFHVSGGLAIRF